MALKPTIYKFKISVSDFNQDAFEDLDLTLAQHPSETLERMLARVLVYCLNNQEGLQFTKGLSSTDEPDLWLKNLQGDIELWIEVGEPKPERIKKASRMAKQVMVYSFNSKSPVWWKQEQKEFLKSKASFFCFPWENIKQSAASIERTNELQISINGNTLDMRLNDVPGTIEIKVLNQEQAY